MGGPERDILGDLDRILQGRVGIIQQLDNVSTQIVHTSLLSPNDDRRSYKHPEEPTTKAVFFQRVASVVKY
jgi:hypothetical protein